LTPQDSSKTIPNYLQKIASLKVGAFRGGNLWGDVGSDFFENGWAVVGFPEKNNTWKNGKCFHELPNMIFTRSTSQNHDMY